MKINSVSMTNRFSKVKHGTEGTLDTDIRVKRIPSHKGNTDTFINLYDEKAKKKYGILTCETCAKRIYKEAENPETNRKVSGEINICPECGRCYDDKGIVNVTKLKDSHYDLKSEALEGLAIDTKV